ncbi:hypothetical protein LZ30DRAFT_201993 [Colletotrichum cereale]|nr:hypothetical protein LZ30DRAFT_201993 [Colletotrichum cereale]
MGLLTPVASGIPDCSLRLAAPEWLGLEWFPHRQAPSVLPGNDTMILPQSLLYPHWIESGCMSLGIFHVLCLSPSAALCDSIGGDISPKPCPLRCKNPCVTNSMHTSKSPDTMQESGHPRDIAEMRGLSSRRLADSNPPQSRARGAREARRSPSARQPNLASGHVTRRDVSFVSLSVDLCRGNHAAPFCSARSPRVFSAS